MITRQSINMCDSYFTTMFFWWWFLFSRRVHPPKKQHKNKAREDKDFILWIQKSKLCITSSENISWRKLNINWGGLTYLRFPLLLIDSLLPLSITHKIAELQNICISLLWSSLWSSISHIWKMKEESNIIRVTTEVYAS